MNIAIKLPIDSFISQLSSKDKIELVRRLERQTRRQRWSGLLSKLQRRLARNPISEKEILNYVKETRKSLNA